jgi:hypothetical protein
VTILFNFFWKFVKNSLLLQKDLQVLFGLIQLKILRYSELS